MIPKNTKKIISCLLRGLEKYNVNQVSRLSKISVGSAFKILKGLREKGILSMTEIGNAKYYRINFDNPEARKICELILLEEKRTLRGYAKVYADEIKEFGKAELIVLFGSVLNKSNFNDVDVLFVTNKVKETQKFCLEISKIKTKPVIGLILKKDDLIKGLGNKKKSLLEVFRTGVVLKGEDVFLEVIENVKK